MDKENVIQKIQKLLKLQCGAESIGSTGEAFQAAKMVKKLLMEYNLSMSDIDTSDGQNTMKMEKSVDMSSGSKYGNHWKFQLLGVIALNNLCQAYKRDNGKMFVVGTEDNVTIVKEFYDYLIKVFMRLGKEHLETKEIDKTAKRFNEDVKSKKLHSPKFGDILFFNVWKAMATSSNPIPADKKYWEETNFINHDFAPTIKLNIIKRAFGKLMYFILKKFI